MDAVLVRLPFPLAGLDTDNGGEFINHALIKWAGEKDIYFTRSRPYKSKDNAHVEQKNGDVVRRHAFHYRYDTAEELKLLNTLWALVRVRLNLFTTTDRLALEQTRKEDPYLRRAADPVPSRDRLRNPHRSQSR